jgi:hypothetical protein
MSNNLLNKYRLQELAKEYLYRFHHTKLDEEELVEVFAKVSGDVELRNSKLNTKEQV